MKLWLLELLACPIDKHFPLKLTILQWQGEKSDVFLPPEAPDSAKIDSENPQDSTKSGSESHVQEDLIQKLIQAYHNQELLPQDFTKSNIQLEQHEENGLQISDLLQIKPQAIGQYLDHILTMIPELEDVQDVSTWAGTEALSLIKQEIRAQIQSHATKLQKETIPKEITPKEFWDRVLSPIANALEFLNQFKYLFEIQEGVMVCPKCHRWYPIFETIPQMLPDEVRPKASDHAFQDRWQEKFTFPSTE